MYQPFDILPAQLVPALPATPALTPMEARTQEHCDILCAAISESTESLCTIVTRLRQEHQDFPAIISIYRMLRNNEAAAAQYSIAKQNQADLLAEEIMTISDDTSGDIDGMVSVQRSKLRVESRKWIAAKLKPAVYGDRADRLAVNIQINNDSCPIDLSGYGI
jgi:hypothetical protein